MLSSLRSPDSIMRIFSSAENWRRVARRISLMTCSAGSFTGSDCCPIFAPLLATMDYQPSLPQPAPSVSQTLTPDMRAMLERVGFGPGDHIVTHCEGGGRAALGAAAALRAGFDDVRVYYLSFADWVRDESCPVVRD